MAQLSLKRSTCFASFAWFCRLAEVEMILTMSVDRAVLRKRAKQGAKENRDLKKTVSYGNQ